MGYPEFLTERTILPKAKISALGCYTPPRVLTNQDLEKMVETNDQWIMDRTGIRERHIAGPEMATWTWPLRRPNARSPSAAWRRRS